jgi:flagellar hook-length control protein FliK
VAISSAATAAAAAPAIVGDQIQIDTPADSSATEERISAVFERAPVQGGASDFEQSSNPGSNLYANTRETVVGSTTSTAPRSEVVQAPVASPRWANEIGSRLMMMSVRGQQEGSLTLTPEHLGPLEVRISVNQDTTNVWFGAQHADTRAALTEALPRLREMFSASGLSLGQAGVSHEMPRQESRGELAGATGQTGETEAVSAAAPTPAARHVRSALLDTWA